MNILLSDGLELQEWPQLRGGLVLLLYFSQLWRNDLTSGDLCPVSRTPGADPMTSPQRLDPGLSGSSLIYSWGRAGEQPSWRTHLALVTEPSLSAFCTASTPTFRLGNADFPQSLWLHGGPLLHRAGQSLRMESQPSADGEPGQGADSRCIFTLWKMVLIRMILSSLKIL